MKKQTRKITITGILVIFIAFFIFMFLFKDKLAITSGNLDYIKSKCAHPFYNVYQCSSYYCIDSNSGRCQDVDSNCRNAPVVFNCLNLGTPSTSSLCMPNTNNLCSEPFINNGYYYCDIDKTINCGSVGCSNGKCNSGETQCQSPYIKYNGKCEIIACGILGNNCPTDKVCVNPGTPEAYCKPKITCSSETGQLCSITTMSLKDFTTDCEKNELIKNGYDKEVSECEVEVVDKIDKTEDGSTSSGCIALEPLQCKINEELKIFNDKNNCAYSKCVKKTLAKCSKFQTLKDNSCKFDFEKFAKDKIVITSFITGFVLLIVIIFIMFMPKKRRK